MFAAIRADLNVADLATPRAGIAQRAAWLLLLGLLAMGLPGPAGAAAPAGSTAPATLAPSRLPTGPRLGELLDQNLWAPAESLATAEMARVRRATPVDSLALAETMQALLRAGIGVGKLRQPHVRPMADSALAIRERHLGPADPLVAESLATLARIMGSLGDIAGSVPLYRRALDIRMGAFGPDHRLVAQSLNSLGVVSSQLGDYAAGGDYFRRALDVRIKLLGPDHREVGDSWNNLAFVLGQSGDFLGALNARERTLAIYEKTFGADHPRLAPVLVSLGDVYRLLGDYDRAIAMEERGVTIGEKSYDPGSTDLASFYGNFASLLSLSGQYERARGYFEKALAIRERATGPDSRDVAATLVNMSEMLRRSGQPAEAAKLAERAVAALARDGGPDAPDAITAQLSLANDRRALGDHAAARAIYRRAIAVRTACFGPHNPGVGDVFRDMAIALAAAGLPDSAVLAALRAETIGREHFRLLARSLPERQALEFAGSRSWGLDVALTTAAARRKPARVAALWDAVIRSRGLVLDEMATRQHSAWRLETPDVATKRQALLESDRELARLLVQSAGGPEGEALRKRRDAARASRELAERALAEASVDYRGERSRGDIDLAAVRAALPPGSALVAYVQHRETDALDNGADSRYVAFVLADAGATPRLVPIGAGGAIDALIANWRDEVSQGTLRRNRTLAEADAACRSAGTALRRAVWDPVASAVDGAARVFVVPDGALHLVNLAALPAPGPAPDRFLVDQEPLLHVMTAERDLVPLEDAPPAGSGLLALGGAAFDLDAAAQATGGSGVAAGAPKGSATTAPSPASGPGGAFRGTLSPCLLFRDVRFGPLPASGEEAGRVAALWSQAGGAGKDVFVLTGAAANEAEVKRLAPGRRLLHLATHGFFIDGSCASGGPGDGRGIGGIVAAQPPTASSTTAARPERPARAGAPLPARGAMNPLRLSGLALAGANHRDSAAPGAEDGVLTAEEIATLDLGATEWAVLSACDTGLGDISSGEGLFGLRRALQVAGARTVILSLWSVRDQDALRWMQSLYRARLVRQADTATAVRTANRELLAERRAAHDSTHPFYWAGFLATGEWR